MKKFFSGLLIAVMAITTSPQGVVFFTFEPSEAEARGHSRGGGMSARPAGRPAGAKTRPATRPSAGARPSTRPAAPSTRPAAPSTRPAAGTRPSTQPATRPATKPATRPAAKPAIGNTRPVGSRPPGAVNRPVGSRPPGSRPPGAGRPPGSRPPGTLPAHSRPPGYRPPHHRPPYYRPPYHRPPYYRPPHYYWGPYYYNSTWGWFFTAVLVTSTLVYVSELPSDDECEKVTDNGETLYVCDGVIYRSTYYKDEQVYEIASDAPEEIDAGPTTVFGLSLTDPMTQGDVVRDMQQRLVDRGYDVGSVDGVFGSSTEAALQWLQYDNELDVTGVVDAETAKLLGYEQQPLEDAEAPPAAVPEATDTPEGGAVNQPLQD